MQDLFHHNVLQQLLWTNRNSVYRPRKRQESYLLLILDACNNPMEIIIIIITIIIIIIITIIIPQVLKSNERQLPD